MNLISDAERQFINFIVEYNRYYETKEEYDLRLAIFEQKLQFFEEFNAGEHKFKVGINKFADWTEDEYKGLLGLRPGRGDARHIDLPIDGYPDSLDWRSKGAVTPVKD